MKTGIKISLVSMALYSATAVAENQMPESQYNSGYPINMAQVNPPPANLAIPSGGPLPSSAPGNNLATPPVTVTNQPPPPQANPPVPLATSQQSAAIQYYHQKVVAQKLPEADLALKNKDYKKALEIYKPLAEQGEAVAQYQLGYLYQHGFGVVKDDQLAAA